MQALGPVTAVAAALMAASASTATTVCEQVLARLGHLFDADTGFLCQTDRTRASKVIAEWPPRVHHPHVDPLEVVDFILVRDVFGLSRDCKEPPPMQPAVVIHLPASANYAYKAYQRQITVRHRVPTPSIAAAPLISSGVITGVLGFVNTHGRKWKQEDLDALGAIAPLFALFEGRISDDRRIRDLAEHDDLTGLHNRRSLVAHLSERLATGCPGPVAVLFLYVHRLKSINDRFGHAACDFYLRVFGERLRTSLGGRNTIARIGGGEFVAVPDQTMPTESAESVVHGLWRTLRDPLKMGDDVITPAVSIGVAVGRPGHDNAADLLHRADEAALTAKRARGNQVAVFSDDIFGDVAFRTDIALHLQGAIDSDALLLHYLPEVNLLTGAILGAEALVRWQHPTRGLLLPDSFIDVAESTNLAGELGRWVTRRACEDFSRWRSHGVGRNATLRVNVSPNQLVIPDFAPRLAEVIDEFGINAESLCLEITERAVVGDIETTRQTLEKLKEVGVQIAIDDFGTGYAVLGQLKNLPVDMLKIDMGFVRDLGTNRDDLAIVRAIIELAAAFDLEVVAEGVETQAAAETLMRHGCYRAQGFLLSRPVAADVMESLLSVRWLPMSFAADSDALPPSAI